METKYKLRLLSSAQWELEQIVLVYSELAGPDSARGVADQIYAALDKLITHPHMGIGCKDKRLAEEGYRMLICENYLCFYRQDEDTVFVRNCFRIT